MNVGLQVFGDNDLIQIDSNFSTLRLVAVHTMSGSGGVRHFWGTLPVSNAAVIAIRVSSGAFCPMQFRSGSPYFGMPTPPPGATYGGLALVADTSATATMYVYDYADPSFPVSMTGLAVFDAAGRTVFRSDDLHMNVVAQITGTLGVGAVMPPGNNHPVPAGVHAVAPLRPAAYRQQVHGGLPSVHWIGAYTLTSGNVLAEWMPHVVGGMGTSFPLPYAALILSV